MTHRVSLGLAASLAATLALTAGCGVSSEEEPQPMDTTTGRQPPVIPSVDIEPSRATSPASPTASSAGRSPASTP